MSEMIQSEGQMTAPAMGGVDSPRIRAREAAEEAVIRLDDPRLTSLPDHLRNFILALDRRRNVALACKAAGSCSRNTAKARYADTPAFKELWDDIRAARNDIVEGTVFDVAVVGHEKHIFGKDGSLKSIEHVRDVPAMKLWLQGNMPEVYGDKKTVTHEAGSTMQEALREIRMSRQKQLIPGDIARSLPASEVKVLNVNGSADDAMSSDGSKQGA